MLKEKGISAVSGHQWVKPNTTDTLHGHQFIDSKTLQILYEGIDRGR